MRLAMRGSFIIATGLAFALPVTAQAQNLDVRGWIDRPGVKLLAVEFYATWCKPCMAAVPKWKELHDKYRRQGLRLVVVATQDPQAGCANPGWNPDDLVCDDDGVIARAFGTGDRLPAAYLWSWQGNLLVRKGHVGEVEQAVKQWLRKAPRVDVEVSSVTRSAGVTKAALRDLVRSELQRSKKLVVVASDAERKRLKAIKVKSFKAGYDEALQCEVGKDVSANSLLDVRVTGKRARQRLQLLLLSADKGCLVGASVVDWQPGDTSVSVAEGVSELLQKLRPEIEMPGGRGIARRRTTQASPIAKHDEMIGDTPTEWSPSSSRQKIIVKFASQPKGALFKLRYPKFGLSLKEGADKRFRLIRFETSK